jgi:nitroimidazol reductase NimA-like FMN-containing flavoprotein (pyridoxamine 5'-phosphate oxidase superfamily)
MLGELNHEEVRALLTRQNARHLGVFGDGRVFVFPVSYG